MSANADVVRANSDAFNRRDAGAMMELFAPDSVVWDRRAVGFGEFRGREAVRAYYEGLFDNVADVHEALEVVSESDGVVVARCHVRVRLAGADDDDADDVSFDYALRVAVRDGVIVSDRKSVV